MKRKVWVDPKYKYLGTKAMEQYPELKDMSAEEAARFIQEKAYKGLPKLRETLGMGNQITNDPQALARRGAHASSGPKGITVQPLPVAPQDRADQLGYLMHEYGHQLDDASVGLSKIKAKRKEYEETPWLPNPFQKLQKYINADDATEAAEEMRKNYPSGKMDQFIDSPLSEEFRSGPSDPKKMMKNIRENGHHMNRDFRLDNIERIKKGGLEEVVQNEEDPRYQNLMNILRTRA